MARSQRINFNESRQFSRLQEKVKGRMKEFILEFAQDLAQSLVEKTPVKTGFLRGSWFASLGTLRRNSGKADPSGQSALSSVGLLVLQAKPGQTIFFANSAEYAAFIEFGTMNKDGTQRIAPRAMVRRTFNESPRIAEEAARRVASRR